MKIVVGVATLAALLAARPSAAQDYRQTVVVTAAATPVELGTVTRTMTVITRDEIAALPVQSVADVLRVTAPIDVRARGDHGVQTDFSVRGAGFGQMLVLVDGVRLNDAQSGHHNGDIPVPLDAVERIEILYGPGSSLFGADAFGGTINVITRSGDRRPSLVVQGGSFGFAGARGDAAIVRSGLVESIAASADRSAGFTDDRDFQTASVQSRTAIGDRTTFTASFLQKAFGANNFYGGNAPSREWTNQTLLAFDRRLGAIGGWRVGANASYRTHGDHFVFNELRPELSDNRHRTHEVLAAVRASHTLAAGSIAVGVEGGSNWIRSTNLGDHDLQRVSAFGEWRQAFGGRVVADASLRVDRYTEFGASWNPAAGIGWWPTPHVKLRASTGRAFRVPTFTERFYSDPANLARPDVGPEQAWAGEGGADVVFPNGWMVQGTVFGRADRDVIDWLRPTVADRWRTYNVRDVDTRGVDLAVRKSLPRGMFAQAQYSYVDVNAAAVNQLSKYLLDYAPHSLVAALSASLPARVRVAPRIEYRRRTRPTGTSEYVLLDVRIARRIGSIADVFIDGTNLLNRSSQEILGVAMPEAAVTASLSLHGR